MWQAKRGEMIRHEHDVGEESSAGREASRTTHSSGHREPTEQHRPMKRPNNGCRAVAESVSVRITALRLNELKWFRDMYCMFGL